MSKTLLIIIILSGFARSLSAQERTIQYFIDQALSNSPLIKDYHNQVQTNLLDSQRIRAEYRPQVNGVSNNSYAPVIHGYGYDAAITNGGQLSAMVGLSQTIVSKKNINNQLQGIRLQNEGLDNAARLTEQDLKRTVTAQYITAFGDMQELRFAQEINDLLKKEEGLLKSLTERNVYRQTDYLTFLVTRQQQELSVRQLNIQLQNDYATLNYLSGTLDTSMTTLAEPGIALNQLPEMEQSIFFRKFTIDSLQLSNSRSAIAFNYKPKINLTADAGYNSSLAYQGYKNFGSSVGLNVILPIYDGHQRQLQYSKLAIAERTRQGYKDFYKNQYRQQVAQLLQQLAATSELITQIDQQIKYAEGLIKVNIKLLETGDAKIADLVIALNTYLTAKNLLTQNKVSRLQIINQINYWNR